MAARATASRSAITADHPGLHRLGHVPVAGADHAALALATAAGLVAHQLVDHPGRDGPVLQPGREGRLAWASVLAVLAAAMVVDRAVSGAHVAVGLGLVVCLVVLARAAGLTAVDLGLARSTWPAGLRWGVGAAALVGAAYTLSYLIMPVRQAIPDPGGGLGRVALTVVLVVIPLGTVLPEELAFRACCYPAGPPARRAPRPCSPRACSACGMCCRRWAAGRPTP